VTLAGAGVGGILDALLRFYEVLIIIYVLMSWFPVRGMLYDVYSVLGSIVEPYLGVFRRVIPVFGGIDFSPWVAILALEFVRVVLATLV
jgi:YggT family protein